MKSELKMTGWVTSFNKNKGFGFITVINEQDTAPTSYFCHCTDILGGIKTLGIGSKVEFRPINTNDGIRAAEVNIVEEESGI